jgi:adenine-specific DNA glycosylase
MFQTYDPSCPSCPIEDLFKQMQDGWAYEQAGQQPYGKQQIINIAYALVFNTGVYNDACKEWEKQDILDKNREFFKAHFTTEHCMYRKQTQTAQATGYQAANHAQQNLQDALMAEQSEALAMLASASATDRTTLSHLVSSNAQFDNDLIPRYLTSRAGIG